jgi:UDP-N-acetylmuramyl pentapeptide synthase
MVQEVGASDKNDMNSSLQLLQPDIGIITNIGLEHFKTFRSRESVAAEKSKLIKCLPSTGHAILNADDECLQDFSRLTPARVFTYGFHKRSDLRALNVSSAWPQRLSLTLQYQGQYYECRTQFCGEHMTHCILAALATALSVGLNLESAIARIGRGSPTLGRMMPYETASGVQFVRDDWKAPYWSIFQPIDFMKQAEARRKIIILGTISDMPGSTSKKYRSVAESALEAADIVYFYGPCSQKALHARAIPDGKTLRTFTNFRELAEHLKSLLMDGDLVLLKGSGADHLARLAIMYDRDLACWRQRCKRENMCDACRLVWE